MLSRPKLAKNQSANQKMPKDKSEKDTKAPAKRGRPKKDTSAKNNNTWDVNDTQELKRLVKQNKGQINIAQIRESEYFTSRNLPIEDFTKKINSKEFQDWLELKVESWNSEEIDQSIRKLE